MERYGDLAGWAAIGVVVAAWDIVVTRRGRPSLSHVTWDTLDRPLLGPAVAGGVGFVAWHLLHRPKGH